VGTSRTVQRRRRYNPAEVRTAFSRFAVGEETEDGEQRMFCPVCEDPDTSHTPSASMDAEKGVWNCLKNNHGGRIWDLVREQGLEKSFVRPATRETSKPEAVPQRPLPDQEAPQRYARALQGNKERLAWVMKERGLEAASLARAEVGLKAGAFVFPVQIAGEYVQTKSIRYRDGKKERPYQTKGAKDRLWPEQWLVERPDVPVLLCEGEWDAVLADQHSNGLYVAITGTSGAKSAPRDLSLLRGREVFVAYDLDDAGRAGAKKVQAALEKAGARAYVLDLARVGVPANQDKADISDYFHKYNGSAAALLTEFDHLRRSSKAGETRHVVRKASEIQSHRQLFLWRDRMPMGTITLFAGSGGVGKSTFALWLLAELQHGRLPGDLEGTKATVLYVSVEDDWATVMKPRLKAAGAAMDRIYQLAVRSGTDESTGERYPLLPEDLFAIREAIEETQADLVIFDPITSTVTGDDHKRGDVRAVLDPLAQLAQETNTAIVGIMHFKKGAGDVSDKVSGSHAYRDTARALMLFAKDEQTGEVIMTQDKGNYADFGNLSLAYRLVDTVVGLDDGDTAHVAKVEIVGDTTTSVSQIVNRSSAPDEAADWLLDYMHDVGGTAPAADVEAAGLSAGFKKSKLTRARARARVQSRKTPSMDGGWEWFLEETAH